MKATKGPEKSLGAWGLQRVFPARLRGRTAGSIGLKVAGLVAIILLWQAATPFLPATILPGPYKVFLRIIKIFLHEQFLFNFYHTMFRVVIGFGIAFFIGTAMGVAMGLRDKIEKSLDVLILVSLTIPGLAWALFALLFFGSGEVAAIFAVSIITFPFVALNVWQGTKAVDRELVEMGRAFRANRAMLIREVILPQLEPYFFASIRIGFAQAWKVVVIAEMFGQATGIGFQLNSNFLNLSMSGVLGWTISFVIIMLLIELLIFAPVQRRLTVWRQRIAI